MKRTLAAALTLTVTACSLSLVSWPACSRRPARSVAESHAPLILVGVDGLEWSVVLEMLGQRRLPHLAGILESGSFGQLDVTRPTLSPIIWTSIATGTTAARHGIHGFVRPETQRTNPVLYASTDRRKKALWNLTSEAGLRTWMIGWWLTFPVETIDGVMVAQVNTATPAMRRAGKGVWKGSLIPGLKGQVHPDSLQPRVLGALGEIDAAVATLDARLFGRAADELGETVKRLREQSRWALRADALYRHITLDLLAGQRAPAFLGVYFGGADVIGHRFWRYMRPQLYEHPPAAAEAQALAGAVPAYYAWLDEAVGELLSRVPAEATVMVVSDHGMVAVNRGSKFRRDTLSGGHLEGPPAFFAAAGPRIRDDELTDAGELRSAGLNTVGSILDIAPTVLALLGLPIGRDMQGTVMGELIDPGHLEAHPVRMVERHTEPGWRPSTVNAELQAPEERLEQLRALGYLE